MTKHDNQSADRLIGEVRVQHFDVLVFGGGVAGLAVAERLGREARRRNKSLRIALVESSDKLGEGSSGRLEGWFHTGALYSGMADGQTFRNCVKGVEHLINWYRRDPCFVKRANCNFDLFPTESNSNFILGPVPANEEAEPWFLMDAAINIAIRKKLEDGQTRVDESQWAEQARQINKRIREAYRSASWNDRELAIAPSPEPSSGHELPGRRTEPEKTDSSGLEQSSDPELNPMLRRYEGSDDGEHRYQVFRSPDTVMNTDHILRDLSTSAAENGVIFITSTELKAVNVPKYGTVRVTGAIASQSTKDGTRRLLHLRAKQYIFALGAGFRSLDTGPDNEFIREKLGLRFSIRTSKSVMAVIYPALIESNFVRMDYYRRNHFNHILRPINIGSRATRAETTYSMIANSAFDTGSEEFEKIAQSTEELLDTAHKYFPETLYQDNQERVIRWYQCNKAEFFSDEEKKRNYSYWCEPRVTETGETNSGGASPLKENLKELTNQILRSQIKAGNCHMSEPVTEAYAEIDRITKDFRRKSKPANFLCTLPGKFTFFPSVAQTVYLEMECRGLLADAPTRVAEPRKSMTPAVAEPYPARLLKKAIFENTK